MSVHRTFIILRSALLGIATEFVIALILLICFQASGSTIQPDCKPTNDSAKVLSLTQLQKRWRVKRIHYYATLLPHSVKVDINTRLGFKLSAIVDAATSQNAHRRRLPTHF